MFEHSPKSHCGHGNVHHVCGEFVLCGQFSECLLVCDIDCVPEGGCHLADANKKTDFLVQKIRVTLG